MPAAGVKWTLASLCVSWMRPVVRGASCPQAAADDILWLGSAPPGPGLGEETSCESCGPLQLLPWIRYLAINRWRSRKPPTLPHLHSWSPRSPVVQLEQVSKCLWSWRLPLVLLKIKTWRGDRVDQQQDHQSPPAKRQERRTTSEIPIKNCEYIPSALKKHLQFTTGTLKANKHYVCILMLTENLLTLLCELTISKCRVYLFNTWFIPLTPLSKPCFELVLNKRHWWHEGDLNSLSSDHYRLTVISFSSVFWLVSDRKFREMAKEKDIKRTTGVWTVPSEEEDD